MRVATAKVWTMDKTKIVSVIMIMDETMEVDTIALA